MEKDELLSGLLQELRRGTIVLSVLSQLQEPQYGYSLVTRLSENGMQVETNTLYPLLRRLESQGLLKSEWDTGEAKPRKYYVITDDGKEIYELLRVQWKKTAEIMNKLLG
ncbi:MAG: helix-turn-helix transcriptional regulator [Lachnospiraceae bacterium]|nr:helix-turn-helix transcriptional regulator [Lachnospiraceae bacterium]